MAVITYSQSKANGLRPLDPFRDLNAVANLIEEAFKPNLDRVGLNALRELRWLGQFPPLLWWNMLMNLERKDYLCGFVWENDEGQVIGNASLSQMGGLVSRRWLLSNVAVSEGYRGQGIGRQLIEASIDFAREQQAHSVLLQVRADNTRAYELYKSFRFRAIAGAVYIQHNRVPKVEPAPLPPQLRLRRRRFDSADVSRALKLAIAATPQETHQEWPVRASRFQLTFEELVKDFSQRIMGSAPAYWVVEENRRLVALVDIIPSFFHDSHTINLIVHPDWRGELEAPLIGRALAYLYRWWHNSITVRHPTDHSEAITTFRDFGFREEQTLLWMKRGF